MNQYAYGFGDPLNGADRSGLRATHCSQDEGCPQVVVECTWCNAGAAAGGGSILTGIVFGLVRAFDLIFGGGGNHNEGGSSSGASPPNTGSGSTSPPAPQPPVATPPVEPPGGGSGGSTSGGSVGAPISGFFPDPLYYSAQFCGGMGDTLSLGITCGIRELAGVNDVIDPTSDAYVYGDYFGTGVGLGLGGAQVARGAFAMGGRSGGLATRFGRGLRRFVSDPRRHSTVSRQYWAARGGAGPTRTLHHWYGPQRAGGSNAGWNLLELPRWLNSRMGPPGPWRAAEWTIRGAVPLSLAGGGAQGAYWGSYRQGWIDGFEE